ncbi:isochorismate synthase [Mycolicibacterium brumae]|uniref:isochorismate synthase n=1 Tax=Mycolicibacterium brumae TaxID=85968 RepID=A0A2G5PC33_9MYCO|nr:isochorismate synthase [Mycolicibacterium brumae]MCV7193190.1 isochorismate synthase [Mycolicibacterium brumae]PIB75901.1 isochorismate synthase [Mycolicibacterium brumae]RWA16627.1 hypothetical protein MBRU_07840 [Mycolicibacterium brumae DSM 44177]UWW09845.1 isochorismate synthase [Mycolicibacterium brumae]
MTLTFALAGPDGVLCGRGMVAAYPQIGAADEALRSGTAPLVVGALPFDLSAPAALHTPEAVQHALPDITELPVPADVTVAPDPDPGIHRDRVAAAITRLQGGGPLQKVVLARALRLSAHDRGWDPETVLRRLLAADPGAYGYLTDLSAADGPYRGTTLVGASPELLVARRGDRVSCRPFAGSAARDADPVVDAANAAMLADSAKDRHEHALVVETMRAALEPLCAELEVAGQPSVHSTDALWHLGTPITGRLRSTATTALDLALALHPTPAVGGVPTDLATELITELEGDRGFYAGATGWCDSAGDGVWVVSIRGAQIFADRATAVVCCGGGVVAESDPDAELAETSAKFRTILAGLGVPTGPAKE